jgi:probable HAF family extracellular repeat protein
VASPGYVFNAFNDPAATSYSVPLGINASGKAVGYYYNSDGSRNAFSYDGAGNFSTFTLPAVGAGGGGFGSTSNVALTGISNSGLVVGTYTNASGTQLSFFRTPFNGLPSTLSSFNDASATNGTFATAINDSDQFVGYYLVGSTSFGFSYNAGTATTINLGTSTVATGINNSGQIVGYFTDGSGTHGFLDNAGSFTTLNDPLAASFTEITGINSSGEIVGFYKDGNGAYHGFTDIGGTFTTVDDPAAASFGGAAGTGTKLTGVNDQGQLVGAYGNFSNSSGIQGFVASSALMTVASGGTLSIGTPFSGSVSFAGSTGTLTISDAADFHGTVLGQLAVGDVIDLTGITAGSSATIGYTGNNSPGTLTVGDGTHSVSIVLTGNYSLGNFTPSSDGGGGTKIIDPPLPGSQSQPLDIADGAIVELTSAYADQATFRGLTGALQLDDSRDFAGTVAGMNGSDLLDLRDIGFGSGSALGYTANASNTGGTLSISDGTHLARINLLGQYAANSFVTASDGHGGTLIGAVQLAASQQTTPTLSLPRQA